MAVADIISNIIFLIMGIFGITAQLKGLNYWLLVGSIGLIVIVLMQYIDKSRHNTQ